MSENDGVELPPLSDETIARIEEAVFDDIAEDRPLLRPAQPESTARRRRRRWALGLGVAAAFAAGILISPPLLSAVSHGPTGANSAGGDSAAYDAGPRPAVGMPESAQGDGAKSAAGGSAPGTSTDTPSAGRDIITTARVTLRVADIAKAADALTALAEKHGGYVESSDIGLEPGARSGTAPDAAQGAPTEPSLPSGDGWVSIRVPAADLTAVRDAVGERGQELGSSISREDVTATAVDLRARVDASKASVQRLTELMSKSGSVADLIAAETALSERQAQLESYQQQLKSLDDQVSMSSVQVQLTKRAKATEANAAGFGDGLLAGWNGLIAALNGVVIAFGFLLPWLAVAGVVLLMVWLIRRRMRKTRVP
jgi:hypothetical protein